MGISGVSGASGGNPPQQPLPPNIYEQLETDLNTFLGSSSPTEAQYSTVMNDIQELQGTGNPTLLSKLSNQVQQYMYNGQEILQLQKGLPNDQEAYDAAQQQQTEIRFDINEELYGSTP